MAIKKSELYDPLLKALQNRYDAGRLSKSELINSIQVANLLQESPSLTSAEALQEVLNQCVSHLTPKDEELLRARFWEQLKVEEIEYTDRFEQLGRRAIHDRQSRAINRLADWFSEKEKSLESSIPPNINQDKSIFTTTVFQEHAKHYNFTNSLKIDFKKDQTDAFPDDWLLFSGVNNLQPRIRDLENEIRSFHFPEVRNQSVDINAIFDLLTFSPPYQLTTKLRFNSEQVDRAGFVFAWQNRSNAIRIQSNIYWNHLDYWEFIDGHLNNRIKTPITDLIKKDAWYWLRVSVQSIDQIQNSLTAYWSNDGSVFAPILRVVSHSRLIGKVGLSTSGPNLPDVDFADLTIEY